MCASPQPMYVLYSAASRRKICLHSVRDACACAHKHLPNPTAEQIYEGNTTSHQACNFGWHYNPLELCASISLLWHQLYWTFKPIICVRASSSFIKNVQKIPQQTCSLNKMMPFPGNLQESDVHLGPLYSCSELMTEHIAFVLWFFQVNHGKTNVYYNFLEGIKMKCCTNRPDSKVTSITCFSVYLKLLFLKKIYTGSRNRLHSF